MNSGVDLQALTMFFFFSTSFDAPMDNPDRLAPARVAPPIAVARFGSDAPTVRLAERLMSIVEECMGNVINKQQSFVMKSA